MGRRKKGSTGMVRVRLVDIPKLKALAKQVNLSLPDYLSLVSRRRR